MTIEDTELEFEEYKPGNKVPKRIDPWITINKKSGLISLNRSLINLIGFKDGDTIKLHQNKKSKDEWYLEVVKGDGGWKPRISKNCNSVAFNSRDIIRNIFESNTYPFDITNAKFLVSNKNLMNGGKTLFFIITKNNLILKNK